MATVIKSGGSYASVAPGDRAWANMSNVAASDNTRAALTTGLTTGQTSETFQITNFGFALPDDAVIEGITVSIERLRSGASTPACKDHTIQLITGGSQSGDNKADVVTNWPAADGIATYGGASDTWGLSLAASDINASNFGIAIKTEYVSGSVVLPQIDHVTITIHGTGLSVAISGSNKSNLILLGIGG